MFGFVFKLVKGAVKGTLLLALVAGGALGYGYYRIAAGKLPAADGAVITAGICRTTPSVSGGTLPVTFQAHVKLQKTHNWLATGGAAGLVSARYEWSHGQFQWVEDTGFAKRQADEVAARKKQSARGEEDLLKDLRSDDATARELAGKELVLRTGVDLGYVYDSPAADRERGAAAWEKWWQDDKNRLRTKAKKGIDILDGALDTLRRALEEPKK